MNKNAGENVDVEKKSKIAAVARGVIVSLVLSLMIAMVMALVMLTADISDGVAYLMSVSISILSAFVGAFVAVRSIKEKGWLWAMICGGIYYIILYIISSAVLGIYFSAKTPVMLLITVLAGAVGGVFAMGKGERKSTRNNKKR